MEIHDRQRPMTKRMFVVSLVAEPGCDPNPIHALRRLLKIALRQFRLRCIDVREEWVP